MREEVVRSASSLANLIIHNIKQHEHGIEIAGLCPPHHHSPPNITLSLRVEPPYLEISASCADLRRHPMSTPDKKRKSSAVNVLLSTEIVDYLKAWMMSPEHQNYPYPTGESFNFLGFLPKYCHCHCSRLRCGLLIPFRYPFSLTLFAHACCRYRLVQRGREGEDDQRHRHLREAIDPVV